MTEAELCPNCSYTLVLRDDAGSAPNSYTCRNCGRTVKLHAGHA